eukprot:m.163596 g.163596  ORF g.163596 m.163596 type:complete len:156 (+) comp53089_c0_seq2:810-1277(+)
MCPFVLVDCRCLHIPAACGTNSRSEIAKRLWCSCWSRNGRALAPSAHKNAVGWTPGMHVKLASRNSIGSLRTRLPLLRMIRHIRDSTTRSFGFTSASSSLTLSCPSFVWCLDFRNEEGLPQAAVEAAGSTTSQSQKPAVVLLSPFPVLPPIVADA